MGLFQKPPTGSFFLLYILILIHFFEYETIVRISTWSVGHSDPDPGSVGRVLLNECVTFCNFKVV